MLEHAGAARCDRSAARSEAAPLESAAEAVQQDFQRLLLVDGVLTGYALFEDGGSVRYLLHPRDTRRACATARWR